MSVLALDILTDDDKATICDVIQQSVGHTPSVDSLGDLVKAVYLMQVKGDKTPLSDEAYEIMNVVEARGQTTNDAKMRDTFEVMFKIFSGTMGHVTPRDINVTLRAMNPEQATRISDDGLYELSAVIQEQKKAEGN